MAFPRGGYGGRRTITLPVPSTAAACQCQAGVNARRGSASANGTRVGGDMSVHWPRCLFHVSTLSVAPPSWSARSSAPGPNRDRVARTSTMSSSSGWRRCSGVAEFLQYMCWKNFHTSESVPPPRQEVLCLLWTPSPTYTSIRIPGRQRYRAWRSRLP